LKRIVYFVVVLLTLGWGAVAPAQTLASTAGAAPDVERWLMRLQDTTRQRAYTGTFVVNTGNLMSTSRIWHVCDGEQQIERIDALTGMRRSTFRHNDTVVTFLPDSRTVIRETRESLGMFGHLLQRSDAAVSHFYRLKALGHARVAGLLTNVVELLPTDSLRFAYRIWTDQQTGLIVQMQTLDASNKILEQAAFSELQLDAKLTFAELQRSMDDTQGYQVHVPKLVKTTAEQEGWRIDPVQPGFVPLRCYKRLKADATTQTQTLQCIYSDGLASVSLFIEPFDRQRHRTLPAPAALSMGATQLRVRQLDNWWLTAVGEVPASTLAGFLQALERTK